MLLHYIKSCKNRNAQGKYRAFASALGLDPYGSDKGFKVYEVEPEDNTFRIPFVKAEQPVKGSYKLQMTVGKMTGSQFVATAVPVTVTTKVSGNRAEPEKTPQEQRLSRIEGVLAVADQTEYDKILSPDVWTDKTESFTDVSPTYEMVSSSNKITVKGSLKKVEGFTGFSEDEKDQNGYYLLARIKLPMLEENATCASMTGTLKALNDKTLTSTDLNYNNSGSRANKEMNDPSCCPAISGSVENMEQYDIVFIGYPIWWGQAPKIICTFMESYDFSGKTIVPFCTSASSGVGSSATNLHPFANNAVWLPGKRFSGSASQSTIMDWVKGFGLNLGE